MSIDWNKLAWAIGFALFAAAFIAGVFVSGAIGALIAGNAGGWAGVFAYFFVWAVVIFYIEAS